VKKAIQSHGARFNGLSLRERVLAGAAALVVVSFLLHTLVVAPRTDAKASLTQQLQQGRSDLATIQSQLRELTARVRDPDAASRQRLTDARHQIEQIDGKLEAIGHNLVPPQDVSRLLQDLLAGNAGLKLVTLRTLPVSGLVEHKAAAPQAAGSATQPEVAEAGIYKHGVEITVEGSYHDLVTYLSALERLPQQLFWSEASLHAEYPLSVLTLTVFTLSLERTWLTV
jgi:MSHA biogenesis protein MshJ